MTGRLTARGQIKIQAGPTQGGIVARANAAAVGFMRIQDVKLMTMLAMYKSPAAGPRVFSGLERAARTAASMSASAARTVAEARFDAHFRTHVERHRASAKCQRWTDAPRQPRNYSITSSARSRNDSAIVRPIACAAFRLTINLNDNGACTGRSFGAAPLRILSAYPAAWRNTMTVSIP